jgi:AcrR family transcriptional regulator
VDVAADLFARHGVSGTNLEDVRRAAGISGSQITHYFRGKQGLVRAVIGWQADAVLEILAQPPSGRSATLPDLRSRASGGPAAGDGAGRRLGAFAGELTEPDPQTRAELAGASGREPEWEVRPIFWLTLPGQRP